MHNYMYFKEAYIHYAMRNLSQTWVFYTGGVAAAVTWIIGLHHQGVTGLSSRHF